MKYATIDRDGCHGDYAHVYAVHDSLPVAQKAERHERAKHSRYQVAEVPSDLAKGDRVHRLDIRNRGVGV